MKMIHRVTISHRSHHFIIPHTPKTSHSLPALIMVTSTSSLREELRETIELRELVDKELHLIKLELRRYKRQMSVSNEGIQLISKELGKIEKSKRTKLARSIMEIDKRCDELDWKVST